ncbi:MAG: OmpA family protein [Bacteroidetes bacterium]|nr:OmpA family protein [Bacteroidota bacterium]
MCAAATSSSRGITALDEPVTLPENYTIEFDVIPVPDAKNGNSTAFTFSIISTTKPKALNYGLARPGEAGIRFSFQYTNSYFAYYNDNTPPLDGRENAPRLQANQQYRISIWVQKERMRLYVDQEKLFDSPRAMKKNYKFNMIRFDDGTPLVGNVRIATGLPDMRSKLLTEGKLVSYGIFFDVNKDLVKPESYPSLKQIAAVLAENSTVRINVVGHTDADGDDRANLDLSKRRALAVKDALVRDYQIDAARIETDGKGESAPVAPNDSMTNKALNRRVEFIKL